MKAPHLTNSGSRASPPSPIGRVHGQAGLVAFAQRHTDSRIKLLTVVLGNVPVGANLIKDMELLRRAKPGRARDARLRRLERRFDNVLNEMAQALGEARPT